MLEEKTSDRVRGFFVFLLFKNIHLLPEPEDKTRNASLVTCSHSQFFALDDLREDKFFKNLTELSSSGL